MTLEEVYGLQDAAIAAWGLAPQFSGQGIVTSIYDREFASGWVLINELARLGVDLPIEVWHRPGELDAAEIEALEGVSPNVRVRLLMADVKGWAVKPFSIMESAFREVLWIDSDNVPVRDPTFLFEDPDYLTKGSLFWRDVSGADRARLWHPKSPVWKVFRVPFNDSEEFDTGQIVIDKSKTWNELGLTCHFNEHPNIYYQFVYGDKDTFRLAWQQVALRHGAQMRQVNYLADPAFVPYGFMPYGPFHLGKPNPWGKWGGGSVMVQRDREGKALFNHRTIFKFGPGENVVNRDVENETFYHAHLSSLPKQG